jgi:hypothetical protein
MTIDDALLAAARAAADRWTDAQQSAEQARDGYHQAIRRLYLTGASMREIAEALGLSHQRVHQIIEASGGVAWKPRSRAGLACSFCGATKEAVSYLIAGPGVYICDACVSLAQTHLDPVPATETLRCSFCDKGSALVTGPGVRICTECLGFCAEVLAAQA